MEVIFRYLFQRLTIILKNPFFLKKASLLLIILALPINNLASTLSRGNKSTEKSCRWKIISGEQKINFSAVQFLNSRMAFGHDNNCFFATQDGGLHWQKHYCVMTLKKGLDKPLIKNKLGNFYFLSIRKGWMLEKDNYLLYTENGGITWKKRKFGNHIDLKKVYFFNEENGWLVGNQVLPNNSPDVRGVIYVTVDGGKNWSELYTGISVNYRWKFQDIWVSSIKDIWVLGDFLIHSTDGGKTWQSSSIDSSTLYDLSNLSIQFTSDIGWIRRWPAKNYLFSNDGGKSWVAHQPPTHLGFMDSLIYINSLEGWATAGNIYHTFDGGKTWKFEFGDETYMGNEPSYYVLHQYLKSENLLIATSRTKIIFCVLY